MQTTLLHAPLSPPRELQKGAEAETFKGQGVKNKEKANRKHLAGAPESTLFGVRRPGAQGPAWCLGTLPRCPAEHTPGHGRWLSCSLLTCTPGGSGSILDLET